MSATYLNVPFREKDEAKALGARWDPLRRSWYVPAGVALEGFARWLPAAARSPVPAPGPDVEPVDAGGLPDTLAAIRDPADLPDVSLLVFGPADMPEAPVAVRGPVHMPETSLVAHDPASTGAVTYGNPRGVPLSTLP